MSMWTTGVTVRAAPDGPPVVHLATGADGRMHVTTDTQPAPYRALTGRTHPAVRRAHQVHRRRRHHGSHWRRRS